MHKMQPCQQTTRPCDRLANLESDLGIGAHQKAVWEVFTETVRTVALSRSVRAARRRAEASERPLAIREALNTQYHRLAREMVVAKLLRSTVGDLYHSLTARQQARADRLLPVLCRDLGLCCCRAC